MIRDNFKHLEIISNKKIYCIYIKRMVRKGEKLDEAQLLKLAEARKKALEVRQEKAAVKKQEKELAMLERKEKSENLKKSIAAKKSKKQIDHEDGYAQNVVIQQEQEIEQEEPMTMEVAEKPKRASARKPKKVIQYEEDSSSSEEEVVVRKVRKNKAPIQHPQEISQDDRDRIIQEHYAQQEQQVQDAERQRYLQQAQQIPALMNVRGGMRTNLFGGF